MSDTPNEARPDRARSPPRGVGALTSHFVSLLPKTKSRARSRGFAIAPILYMLGLVGIGAGVLFSGYSQILRSNAQVTNDLSVKNDLQAAATTMSATSVLGADGYTVCPPTAGGDTSNCSSAPEPPPVKLAPISGQAQLPANAANAGTSDSATGFEVGVFAAASGIKQLDAYGHYYIVCRWERPNSDGTDPSFMVISAGPNGSLETTCSMSAPPAGSDDQIVSLTATSAVNRAAVWQQVGSGTSTQAQFGALGSQLKVDAYGDVSTPGTVTALSFNGNVVGGSIAGTTGALSGNTTVGGTLGVVGGTSLTSLSVSGTTSVGGALGVTGATTISSTLGVTGTTTLAGLSATNGAFSGALGVTGNTTLGGTLSAGTSTLDSAIITNNATVGGTLGVTGAASVGSLTSGASTLDSATITNGATVGGALSVAGDTTVTGTLSAGVTTLNSLTVTNNVVIGGTLGLTGNLTGTNATFSGTVTAANFNGAFTGNVNGSATNITGVVAIANGGTGATSASAALNDLFGGDTSPGATLNVNRLAADSIPGGDLINGTVTSTQLNTTGVAAGTYNEVVVGADGRVTSGTFSSYSTNQITDTNNDGVSVGTANGGTISFIIGGTTLDDITSNGDLGLGQLSPSQKLDVNGNIRIEGAAGTSRELQYTTGATSERWTVTTNATAETGNNAGSDFAINSFTDSGTALGTPMLIQRSTGNVTFSGTVTAAEFFGSGAGLTNIPASSITGTITANVTLGVSTSAANPQISGDATSGFYTPGAQAVAVTTGGVERMLWDSSGNTTVTTGYLNITSAAAGLKLGGVNGISFPASDTTTDASTAVGAGALANQSASAAYYNTALGYQTLSSPSIASGAVSNTAVGASALASDTSGAQNAAVGRNALNANTTASYNTAVGSYALAVNTTGGSNTAVGQASLFANTGGIQNTGLGVRALQALVGGNNNVGLGYFAGSALTYGGNNTLIGFQVASSTLTSGSGNILIGNDITTDTYSSTSSDAIGLGVGVKPGSGDIAIGYQALHSNAGDNLANTAIGYGTLASSSMTTAAADNTALGYQSLANTNAGGNNTAGGYQVLFNNTAGAANTALGLHAMFYSTTGSFNTAIGVGSLFGVGTGSGLSGNGNTGVGANALFSIQTTANSNTALGTQTGKALTTGVSNTLIGAAVGLATLTTGSSNILIGTSSTTDTPTPGTNNWLNIGNTIYGNLATSQIGIGYGLTSITAGVALDLSNNSTSANSSLLLPIGSTSTRPTIGVNGMVRYNTVTPAIEAYVNNSWTALLTSASDIGGGITLGTSATAPNPFASATDTETGLYTAGAGKVDITSAGTQIVEWSSAGENIVNAAKGLLLGGQNGITYPATDTMPGGSIAIGSGALAEEPLLASEAYSNTAVGYHTLGNTAMTTAAVFNTAVGFSALSGITAGFDNTATGFQALKTVSTGSYNSAFGWDALVTTSTGNANSAFGYNALRLLTTGSYNTALGLAAGFSITSGAGNTLVGDNVASTTLSSGSSNILIGVDSTTDTYSATSSTAVGIGQGVHPGSNDVAIGYQALHTNGGDSLDNTAIGYQALASASMTTAAVLNTALGYQALTAATSAYWNTALGGLALTSNLTGVENTALGYGALKKTTGPYNTAVGSQALINNASGQNNVAVGHAALGAATGTNNSTAIGNSALSIVTNGASNTGVGGLAGSTITSGSNNTILGAAVASTTLASGSSNILIGTSSAVDTPAPATSNFLDIGNVIFATGMTGTLSAPAGNVGIGTASPGTYLDINGASSGAPSSTIGMVNVYSAHTGPFFTGHEGGGTYSSPYGIYTAITDNATSASNLFFQGIAGSTTTFSVNALGTGYFAGNVGIGTASPITKLHLENGSTGISYTPNGRTVATIEGNNLAGTTLSIIAPATGYSGLFLGSPSQETTGQIQLNNASGNMIFITNAGNNGNTMVLTSAGFVGIGSTSPRAILDLSQNTGAEILPVGTTGQEPTSPVNGMIRYNTTIPDIEAYIGNTWTPITTGGDNAEIYLGTSAIYPNLAASATDTETGLYTAGAGKVDITSAGTQVAEFNSTGLTIPSGSVAIGTTSSAGYNLVAIGSSSISDTVAIENTSPSGLDGITFKDNMGTNQMVVLYGNSAAPLGSSQGRIATNGKNIGFSNSLTAVNPDLVVNGTTGYVGIGTTAPTAQLNLYGVPATFELTQSSGSAGVGASIGYDQVGSNRTSVGFGTLAGGLGYIAFSTGSGTNYERMRITSGGAALPLVGIGTTTPQNPLDVYGAVAIGASYAGVSTAPANGLIVQGNVGIGTTSPVYALSVGNFTSTTSNYIAVYAPGNLSNADAGIKFMTSTGTATSYIQQDSYGAYAGTTGSLGHGLNFASGRSGFTNFFFRDNNDNVGVAITDNLTEVTSLPYAANLLVGGSVGIGTTSPAFPLEITGSIAGASNLLNLYNNNSAAGSSSTLRFTVSTVGDTSASYAQIAGIRTQLSPGTTALAFSTSSNGSSETEAMRIDSTGYVGIGSTVPRAILDLSQNTGAEILPIGTTGQEPTTPVNGMIRYNSTIPDIEAYIGNTWTPITTGGDNAEIYLGTSAIYPNLSASATDTETGLYTAGAGKVDITSAGTQIVEWSSAGENIVNASKGLLLGGQNGITYPSTDSTPGASIAIGSGALVEEPSLASTAFDNMAIGYHALGSTSMTTNAVQNVAIGFNALVVDTTGSQNVAVGNNSLSSNTTGAYNTAVGRFAALSNTAGQNNTTVGYNTFYYATGTDNTTLGATAMFGVSGQSTGNNDTAIGYQSLYGITSGGANTALGAVAGKNITSGQNNTVIGYSVASTTLSSGSDNILIGVDNTTDTYSATSVNAVGIGFGVKPGTSDIAIGYQTLHTNAGDGLNNTAVGYQVLSSASMTTTANSNTAVGYLALKSDTTGYQNVVLGDSNLQANTTGFYNTAIGSRALYANQTGQSNTANGHAALYSVVSSNANSALGDSALKNTTGGANSAFGFTAGLAITTGNNNTIMGSNVASTTLASGSSNILIGTSSAVDTPAASTSNWMNIGNTIYGNLSTNQIGIGNGITAITAGAALDLSSNTTSSNSSLILPVGSTSARPTVGFNGMIRYNSTTPAVEAYINNTWTTLEAAGSITGIYLGTSAITPNLSASATDTETGLYTAEAGKVDITSAGTQIVEWSSAGENIVNAAKGLLLGGQNGITYPSTDSTAGGSIAIGVGALVEQPLLASEAYGNTAVGYQTLNSASMTTTATDNTAVGYQALKSNTSGTSNTAIGYNAMANSFGGAANYNTAIGAGTLIHDSGTQNIAIGNNALQTQTGGSNNLAVGNVAGNQITTGSNNTILGISVASTTLVTGSSNILIGTSNAVDTPTAGTSNFLNIGNVIFATGMTGTLSAPVGNVGIGTTTPGAKLQVNAGTNQDLYVTGASSTYGSTTGSTIFSANDTNTAFQNLSLAATNIIMQAASGTGNVGIGTTSPSSALNVAGTTTNTIVTVGPSTSSNSNASLYLTGTSGGIPSTAKVFSDYTGDLAMQPTLNGNIYFYEGAASGSGTNIMALTAAGNVGIGTTTPGYPLDVNGVINTETGHLQTTNPNGALVLDAGPASQAQGGVYIRADTTLGNSNAYTNLMYISSGGNVGIGSTVPRAILDLSQNTGAEILPIGTTGQEPTSPVNGMIRYNSTIPDIEAYIGNSWTPITTGGDNAEIYLGTSAIYPNLAASATDTETGLYTAGAGKTDITSAGTQIVEWSSAGENIVNAAKGLLLGGQNGITYPSTDSLAGGSIAIGNGALAEEPLLASAAFQNTAVGYHTLNSASMTTSAAGNTAIGASALSKITAGYSNTAVGEQAAAALTIGTNNTVVGQNAMYYNSSGSSNAVFGEAAGLGVVNDNYSSDSIFGYRAGFNITTGGSNSLFGSSTGSALTSGASNTILGSSVASTTLASGSDNILIGVDTTTDAYSAASSTAIGIGFGVKPGSGDIAIGYQALHTNAGDNLQNVAVGYQTLSASSMTTAATGNTAVGYVALSQNTSGAGNTAVGSDAMVDNTTGGQNTALGNNALGSNTAGVGNTAIGRFALPTMQGNSSTGVGYNVMYYQTGGGNTALGADAMFGASGSSTGTNNTAVGGNAANKLTTGSTNTVLGYGVASTTLASGSSNILIGTSSAVDTPTAGTSNFLNIGNTIYGNLSTGYVGIGTTSPTDYLNIVPASAATNGFVNVTTAYGGPFFIGHETGPSYVSGNAVFIAKTDNTSAPTANYYYQGLTGATINFSVRADGQGYFAGNVGIGTTAPLYPLQVYGAGLSSGFGNIAEFDSGTATAGNIYDIAVNKAGTQSIIMGINKNTATGAVPANAAFISTATSAYGISIGHGNSTTLNTSDLYIDPSGNVGIGSTVPRAILDLSQNTGAEILPIGTTGQEPSTPVNGMIRYNTTIPDIEAYIGNSWTPITTGGDNAEIYLGTSAIYPNLSASATDTETGLYTAGAGKVDITSAGTQVAEFSSSGLNIVNATKGLLLGGANGITYPSTDSTPGASIAIGSSALAHEGSLASTAFGNTAIGYQALSSASMTTAAVNNTAVGLDALVNDTSGSNNTSSGYKTLVANTSGANNTADGVYSLYANTTGSQNTAVGFQALTANTTGIDNTALGVQSLDSATTGNNNLAVGYNTGNKITTGGSNTILGINVASTTLATGSNNILIGTSTSVDTPLASTSNFLNIGNTLEGNTANASAIGGEALYLNSVVSSVNYVQISGGAMGTGPTIAATGTDTNVTLNLTPQGTGNVVVTSGNVGIGTTNPNALVSLGNSSTNQTVKLATYDGGSSNLYGIGITGGALSFGAGISASSTPQMVLYNTGNVGIGSTVPRAILDLSQNTGAEILPIGTTGQEPSTPVNGMIRYNSTIPDIEAYIGNSWTPITTGGDTSTIYLGTSAIYPNLSASGTDTETGLYTAGAGKVDITSAGTQIVEWSSAGENIVNASKGLLLGGQNGITYPSTDSTPGGSVAIGSGALAHEGALASTAFGDTAVGYQTLASASMTTAAQYNTAIGFLALNADTTGNANTALGNAALKVNTTGQYNLAVGVNALSFNTTGYQNVGLGDGTLGASSTTGSYNTAVGHQAVYNNTTGNYNSAIGVNALHANTTGTNNTVLGASVAQTTLATGSYNILIGADATTDTSSTSTNYAIGLGEGVKPGAYDVAIGFQALHANAGDSLGNTAIGYQTLSSSSMTTAATFNTAVGYGAASSVTAGGFNTALGRLALNQSTTGVSNTAIGDQSMRGISGAYASSYNVAVGDLSLYSIQGGSASTGIGEKALFGSTTGSNNTALGFNAGLVITTGSSNTILGYSVASTTLATGSNNILIGASSAVDTPAAGTSNWLNIGNTIYGNLSTNSIAIGNGVTSVTAGAALDLSSNTTSANSSLLLPIGTTGTRPITGVNGMVRYNSATPAIEAYVNNTWAALEVSGSASGISLGTSTTAANPQISGDATSGFYTPAASTVAVTAGGVEVQQWNAVSSSVNYFSTSPAITGSAPTLAVVGSDTNITLLLTPKGTGNVKIATGALNINSASSGLLLNGTNGITYPSTDSTPGGSIAIGASALAHESSLASTAFWNTAIGYQALSSASMTTTAVQNVAVGYNALANDSTGQWNVGVGYQALAANTTAQQNVAVGTFALASNSTGGNNTAVGHGTMNDNVSGVHNSIIGADAGYSSNGSYNTVVGAGAGGTYPSGGLTTGSNNTILGYDVASTTLSSGSSNILIGTSSAVDAPTAGTNNFLNIGNTIYGNLSSGSVAIGTTTPNTEFNVQQTMTTTSAGNTSMQYNLLTVNPASAGGANYIATMNYAQLPSANSAGITAILEGSISQAQNNSTSGANVADLRGAQNLVATSGNGTATLAVGSYNYVLGEGTGTITTGIGAQGEVQNISGSTITSGISVQADLSNAGTVGTWYGLYVPAATNTGTVTTKYPLYVADTGNSYFAGSVGIGYPSPSDALDVSGLVAIGSSNASIQNTGLYVATPRSGSNTGQVVIGGPSNNAGALTFLNASGSPQGTLGYASATSNELILGSNGGSGYMGLSTGGTERVSITTAGNVGIGSTVPRAILDLSQNTGAEILPIGTTGQEPTTPVNGMIRYNSTIPDIEAYIGNSWTPITTGGDTSTIYLGTSAIYPNLSASGTDTETGLYTAGAGKVDITSAGTQVAEFSSSGLNIVNAANGLLLGGQNGITYPSSDTTQGNSIAIGPGALLHQSASSAYANIAIGYNDLSSSSMTTAATYNIAIGASALPKDTSGYRNTAIGYIALYQNTSGSANNGIGEGAIYSNQTGSNNNALGQKALYQSTGSTNTAIGDQAGQALTIGNNNTILGAEVASGVLTSGSGNILIGTGGTVTTPAAGTNYNLNIGNLLQGDMTYSTALGTEALYLQSASSGVNYVQITGAATGVNPILGAAGTDANISLSLTPKGTGNVIVTSGNVGIGTASPQNLLHVYESGGSGGIIVDGSSSYGANVDVRSTNAGGDWWRMVSAGTSDSSYGAVGSLTFADHSTTAILTIARSGSVGIGSSSPRAILDLSQNTGAAILPIGTTGQEPTSPVNGMIRYNSTIPDLEAYIGGTWTTLTTSTGPDSGVYLGTSAAAPNPEASATDTTTGLYTAGAGKVDITATGTQVVEWSSSGENIVNAAKGLLLGGQNGMTYPSTDSTPGGSVAIGSSALAHEGSLASTAFDNTAIGYQALSSASMTTAVVGNTAVGFQALSGNTGGANDTAFGTGAAQNTTTGSANVSIGVHANLFGTTGGSNTAVGSFAMLGTTGNGLTGGFNTAIGGNSLSAIQTTAANNTALGYQAGKTLTTGTNNTILGNNVASTTLTTGASNILIGTSTAVDTPAANTSNFLDIGNVIFATGMTGTLSAPAGSVGIGTTVPFGQFSNNGISTGDASGIGGGGQVIDWYQNSSGYVETLYNANTTTTGDGLLIKGAGNTTNALLSVDYGAGQNASGTALFRVLGNGNVGIGTSNPGQLLDVNGAIKTGDTVNGSIELFPGVTPTQSIFWIDNPSANYLRFSNGTTPGSGTGVPVVITNFGNVGIGTTAPGGLLSVYQSTSTTTSGIYISNASAAATTSLYIDSSGFTHLGGTGASPNALVIQNGSGNVGIGTTSPGGLFGVYQSSSGTTGGIVIQNSSASATTSLYIDSSGNTHLGGTGASPNAIVVQNSTGYIGIGTTAPAATMDVVGSMYSRSNNAGSSTTINWATSNTQYTTASCGAFTFSNMQDGGTYQLFVEGTTSGTCSFTESGVTFRLPPNYGATTSGTMTVFSFTRAGTYVFVSWIPGY